MKDNFYNGDRVFCLKNINKYILKYDIGTVIIGTVIRRNSSPYQSIGVKWDKNVNGHSCGNKCECGYGWYVPSHCVQYYCPKKYRKLIRNDKDKDK